MLTTSHGIVGYLLYKKSLLNIRKIAIAGAVLPDLILWLNLVIAFFFLLFGGGGPSFSFVVVHNELHEHAWLGYIENFSHSIFLWIPILFAGYFLSKKLIAFSIGGISHVITDLLTHQGDLIWNHLYPLPVEKIQGIVNYRAWPFFTIEHIIVAIIFIPMIVGWYKKRRAGGKG